VVDVEGELEVERRMRRPAPIYFRLSNNHNWKFDRREDHEPWNPFSSFRQAEAALHHTRVQLEHSHTLNDWPLDFAFTVLRFRIGTLCWDLFQFHSQWIGISVFSFMSPSPFRTRVMICLFRGCRPHVFLCFVRGYCHQHRLLLMCVYFYTGRDFMCQGPCLWWFRMAEWLLVGVFSL
jgi:hypothetical protein